MKRGNVIRDDTSDRSFNQTAAVLFRINPAVSANFRNHYSFVSRMYDIADEHMNASYMLDLENGKWIEDPKYISTYGFIIIFLKNAAGEFYVRAEVTASCVASCVELFLNTRDKEINEAIGNLKAQLDKLDV
jgi:hypothetical protein